MYTLGGQRVQEPGGEPLINYNGFLPAPAEKVGIDLFVLVIAKDPTLANKFEGSIKEKTAFVVRIQAKIGTNLNFAWYKGDAKTAAPSGTTKIPDNSTIVEIPFTAEAFGAAMFGGAGNYKLLVNDKFFSNFITIKE
ncbi:MAG TPA: hypothetical protein VIQ31_33895 [Phormidium sp.]